MAGDHEDRGVRTTLRKPVWIGARNTLGALFGGTIGLLLIGGFETRADFLLFIVFCVLFGYPFMLFPSTAGRAGSP